MAAKKTTYRTIHPTTREEITFIKGGRAIRWATWGDFNDGRGFQHLGYSSQEEYAKALKAPRSTNPYVTRYQATPATISKIEALKTECTALAGFLGASGVEAYRARLDACDAIVTEKLDSTSQRALMLDME